MKYLYLLPLLVFCYVAKSQPAIQVTKHEVCEDTVSRLIVTSTLAPSAIALISWDLDNDGFYDDMYGDTIDWLFGRAGVYPVNVQITANDNKEYRLSQPVLVKSFPVPVSQFTINSQCEDDLSVLSDISYIESGSIQQYEWDVDNDNNVDFSTPTLNYEFGQPGIYPVTLKVKSDSGCVGSITKSINIYHQPLAAYSVDSFCSNRATVFTDLSSIAADTIMDHQWFFGDGDLSFAPEKARHQYASGGSYNTFLVVVSDHSCRDTFRRQINVNEPAIFTLFPGSDTSVYEGRQLTLSVSGNNIAMMEWSDGSFASGININSTGTYGVTVTDINGCVESASLNVEILQTPEVKLVAEILTPNTDGFNDFMAISSIEAFNQCQVAVYNARGVEVFSDNNYTNTWDGTNKGKPLPGGPYYYTLSCDGLDKIVGNINILR